MTAGRLVLEAGNVLFPAASLRSSPDHTGPRATWRKRFVGKWLTWLLLAVLGIPGWGCMVPRARYYEALSQARSLREQHRAQAAEIENLRAHSRNVENQLMRTEQELALLEDQLGLDREQLANYQREHGELQEQLKGLVWGIARLSPEVAAQLSDLSRRFPDLQFDPLSGVSKLDTDVLFDSGSAEVKPGAEELLKRLARALCAPEAENFKVLIVGHTDDRQIQGKPVRELYPSNFHLSSARALAVAEVLRKAGLPDERLGIVALADHQPVAPNTSPADRQKNRRAEIFVMAPEVPVVGWAPSDTQRY